VILFPNNEQRTKKTFLPEKIHEGDETDNTTLGEADNKQTNKQVNTDDDDDGDRWRRALQARAGQQATAYSGNIQST
jgi:hypothetical protein